MHVIIAYDISDNKIRSQFFSFLKEKGIHSQKSVFECDLDRSALREVYNFMNNMDLGKKDSVVFYPICKRCAERCIILGRGLQLINTEWIII